MKTVTPGGTISPKQESANHAGIAINTAASKAPRARYGANASRLALLKECFTSLLRKPTTLLMTLALILPASIVIFSTAVNSIEKNLLDSRRATVFLADTSDEEATNLAQTLATNKYILAAELIPIDLQTKQVLSIDIQPATTLNKSQLDGIVAELNSHTLVDYVALNPAWLERNVAAISKTRQLRWLSITVAALFTVALVYLFTSSDLRRQKSDLRALRQMGASGPTMLKPLMVRCLVQALLAGAIGTLLACLIIVNMISFVDLSTYRQILPDSLPLTKMVLLIALAIFSSFLAVRLFGRKILIT